MKTLIIITLVALMLVPVIGTGAQGDPVEVRFTCYQDGKECEVYGDLLATFMEENPDISVVIDQVEYQNILDVLPLNVETGQGPDIARLTNFSDLSEYYLDLRPLMEDPSLFDNFNAAVIDAFRPEGDDSGLYGYPDALTVTAPFVNASLFEQAGVELLGEGATWEEWIDALTQVSEATGTEYLFAIDNRGHRFAGPAMSEGATFFDDQGNFDLAGDEGFSTFAEMLKSWLDNGQSPADTWASGEALVDARSYFSNAQTVMYFSGSWQVGGFADTIGDAFDWVVVPNPTGPGGSTGVAGGAGIVAFDNGDEAKAQATARVIEYLLQPEVYAEFSGRTLNIPAHAGALEVGVTFDTDNPLVEAALNQFAQEATKLQDQALLLNIHPFAFAYYGSSNTRLQQYFAGEISLEEVTVLIQQDIDDAIANAE